MTPIAIILGSLTLAGLLAIVVVALIGRCRSRVHDPFDPKSVAIAKRKRHQRLMSPQWGHFDERFRMTPPHALRRWYADHNLITTDALINLRDSGGQNTLWDISAFQCMDAREIENRWDCLDGDLLEIASDGFGNPFLVRITNDVHDPSPVWFWMHDGAVHELEPVCASLDEFREWARRSR